MIIHQNPARQAIYEHIVKPALDSRHPSTVGVVQSYDRKTRRATVRVTDGITGAERIIRKVPVRLSKGFADYDLTYGDRVLVEYHAGSPDDPFISFLYDESYETKTRETRQAPDEPPQADNRLPFGQTEKEDIDEKRYVENGRVGIIHPTHRTTYRIDNVTGNAEIVASRNGSPAAARVCVRSDGTIEQTAPTLEHNADYATFNVQRNGLIYNGYPLNEYMAELSQPGLNMQCIMATPEHITQLMAAIQSVPGAQGVVLHGVAPYGAKVTGHMEEWVDELQRIVEKYFPEEV